MLACFRLGDPLAVSEPWGLHVGIVVGFDLDGEPILAHNSWRRGRAVTERLDAVARGKRVFHRGLPRRLPAEQVVSRALAALGSEYSYWRWNCEDFVGYALGLAPRSPQREAWTIGLSLAAGVTAGLAAAKLPRGLA